MILSTVLGLVALWLFAGVVVLGLCWSAARGDRAQRIADDTTVVPAAQPARRAALRPRAVVRTRGTHVSAR